MSQESTNRSFDDLARALAEGSISRRRALRLFAGTAVAALIPSTRALADDDDHDGYTVCHVPGTPPNCDCTRARTRRGLSRRERNRHLRKHPCDSRGNCRNNPYCGTTTSTTTSTSTSTTTTTTMCLPDGPCSPGGTPCCSGNCSNGFCCPTGYVGLSNGTCAKTCSSSADCSASCQGCGAFVSGTYCYNAGGSQTLCTSDSQCPRGEVCAGRTCNPVCS